MAGALYLEGVVIHEVVNVRDEPYPTLPLAPSMRLLP